MELPNELWSYIFHFLPLPILHKTVSLVCKHWLKIVREDTKHLKLSSRFFMKYYDLRWDMIYGVRVPDKLFNEIISEYLEVWPKLQSIDLSYIGKKREETFMKMSLKDFKRKWNLPFLKTLKISCWSFGSECHCFSAYGLTFESHSINVHHMFLSYPFRGSISVQEWISNLKSFLKLMANKEIQSLTIHNADYMSTFLKNSELVGLLHDFLTVHINSIRCLSITDQNSNCDLLPVLNPLMIPCNSNLEKVSLIFKDKDTRGIGKDFKLLQNLNNLTTLKITDAVFRFVDFDLIGQACQSLEVFHLKGQYSPNSLTYLSVSQLADFLSGFKSMKSMKDMRIINISPLDKHPDPNDFEERYVHACSHPRGCKPVQKKFKNDVNLLLVDIMKQLYASNCFILILYYNIHYSSLDNIFQQRHDLLNLRHFLIAKDRAKEIRLEYMKFTTYPTFPEYFDGDNCWNDVLKTSFPQND